MNESQPGEPPKTRRPRRYPVVLPFATLALVLFILATRIFKEALSDGLFHFDFAITNFLSAVGIALLLMGWAFWLWRLSGWSRVWSRVLPLLGFIVAIGCLVTFRPVFSGGMGISRWEPRFWEWRQLDEVEGGLLASLGKASPGNFTQFLGTNRNGIVEHFAIDPDSFVTPKLLWKQDVGQAWSGLIAQNGYVATMEQRGSSESIICYQIQSGQVAWEYSYRRRHDDSLGGVGPRATPTLDGELVFAQGANGMLSCVNANTGELIWQQDLCPLLGIELVESTDPKGNTYQTGSALVPWGRAGSPLVVDELVVVPAGGAPGDKQVSLIAFDKEDGSEVWRSGTDGISYSSPVLYELAGRRQIVIVNEATVSGHEPATGEMLWSYDHAGTSNADANTSQPVLVGDSRLLLSKGYGMGGELVEVSTSENGSFTVASIWKNPKVLKTKLTSAVVHEGHAYALSDGILECVNLKRGDRVWKKGRFGHGQLLIAGDKLLVHSERGSLHLLDASPGGFNELESFDTVSGICWNTICICEQYILVRSDIEMACFQVSDED